MDQHIFDQLDQLERGARLQDRSLTTQRHQEKVYQHPNHEQYEPGHLQHLDYGRDRGFGYPDSLRDHQQYFNDEPLNMDAFDEQLLRQPDPTSRQGQATFRRTRLSLPPAEPIQDYYPSSAPLGRSPPTLQRPTWTRYALGSEDFEPPSLSPVHQRHVSSSILHTPQRYPPSCGNKTLAKSATTTDSHPRTPVHTLEEPSSQEREWPTVASARHATQSKPTHGSTSRAALYGTPTVQGINLVPTQELPDRFRPVFSFPLFNAVQSKCFGIVYRSNDNFVVSAPTGSGKTAVLELAICRLVSDSSNSSFKIVYQAPTKSLCSERQRDWQAKFGPLGLQCAELTGDTEYAQLRNVQHASIIITTPEKWDSMTRKWKDNHRLMQMVKLFLIDEVHILKEDRGATLEAVVSRMKSVGSNVRFVALSATIPNSHDIATWLGKDSMNPQIPAPRERFGEEFRPVRLQRRVCGYQANSNDFAFEKVLNGKLTDIITKWSQRKPIMIFCFTRRSCVETAKLLATWWASKGSRDQFWTAPRNRIAAGDKDLRETIPAGVAFHHAGLTIDDRTTVERAYLTGEINVICCTSTLAVGVNLPCHMVIIKNTVTYHTNGGIKEYSDLEIMQMLGRAGRPQFDNSAVAVIMTRLHRVEFYEKMTSGQETLESCLHLNLIDHLNAEIGLGTVTSVPSAKKWLTGTFLYDNPNHYKIAGDAPNRNIDERLDNICTKGIALLAGNDLIQGTTKLQCTEFGDAMARYYLQFDTMKKLLALPPKAKMSEILSAVSQAAEFKEIRFRAGEKPVYRDLNKNSSIKFPIPVNVDSSAHKVSLVLQSTLGAIDLPTNDDKHHFEYNACKLTVFQHVHRLIRCVIDCQLYLEDSISARHALMLARSFGAQVWDDSPLHIKQIEGIGPVAVRKLVAAGIKSVEELDNSEPHRIEGVLARNPPFGTQIQNRARAFPRLRISMKTIGDPIIEKGECVALRIEAEIGFMNEKIPETFNRKPVYVCFLADTSDGRKVHFARISAKKLNNGKELLFSAKLTSASQMVRGFIMCDEFAGTQRSALLKPEIPIFMFPTPKTAEESSKHCGSTVNAPNVSKRRAVAEAQPRPTDDDDEFGDLSIDDMDLAAAAENDGFVNIENMDDSDDGKGEPQKVTHVKSARAAESAKPWEPRKLDNGKWACNHQCKDKKTCRHLCCREGLDRKPKQPKLKEPKKNETASDPKQTQLEVRKTKETNSGSLSTTPLTSNTPVCKANNSTEFNNLDQLHNDVKGSTPKVPLFKERTGSQATTLTTTTLDSRSNFFGSVRHPDDDATSSDYGLESLDTGDFPDEIDLTATKPKTRVGPAANADASDEMLDIMDHDHDGDDITGGAPVGSLDPETPKDNDSVTFNTHAKPTDKKHAKGSPQSNGIFIVDESCSSSGGHVAAHNPPKHIRDIPKDMPPPKRVRTSSCHGGPRMQDGAENNPFDEDVIAADAGTMTQNGPPNITGEGDTESVKEWFYREFGDELFHFTG